jgi:thiamine pyrophosphate-dependent acetolactate synthase large subunit-like protein
LDDDEGLEDAEEEGAMPFDLMLPACSPREEAVSRVAGELTASQRAVSRAGGGAARQDAARQLGRRLALAVQVHAWGLTGHPQG